MWVSRWVSWVSGETDLEEKRGGWERVMMRERRRFEFAFRDTIDEGSTARLVELLPGMVSVLAYSVL